MFVDREFSAKLRIIKKDANTKRTVLVPNAEFKIYHLDTKQYGNLNAVEYGKINAQFMEKYLPVTKFLLLDSCLWILNYLCYSKKL